MKNPNKMKSDLFKVPLRENFLSEKVLHLKKKINIIEKPHQNPSEFKMKTIDKIMICDDTFYVTNNYILSD